MLSYRYKAYEPGVKTQAVEMAFNGSGIRDTARVLKINKGTVISALKKSESTRDGQSCGGGDARPRRSGGEAGTGRRNGRAVVVCRVQG